MGSAFHIALCQETPRSCPEYRRNKIDSAMASPLLAAKQKLKQKTPIKSVFSNPFEIGLTERLHLPAMSPSVFTTKICSKEDKDKSFRWSIEQMATLHPAEIDDVFVSQDSSFSGFDNESEQRAQDAINRFFSQRQIVPSPWLQYSRVPSVRSLSGSSGSESTEVSNISNVPEKQDASTQTKLTLPIDFDLEKILGDYCTFQNASPKNDCDEGVLSTSTLRRKLFFQEDDNCHTTNGSLQVSNEEHLQLTPSSEQSDRLACTSLRVIKRTSNSPLIPPISPTVSPINNLYSAATSIESSNGNHLTNLMTCNSSDNAVFSASDAMRNARNISLAEIRSPNVIVDHSEAMIEGTPVSSILPTMCSDLGYHTYQSANDGNESKKTQPTKLFPSSPPDDNLRMSWAPVQFSTPSHNVYNDGMSIDSLIS